MNLKSASGRRGAGSGSRRSSPDALANERQFLLQSMEDLEDQRAAGEVDEEDFAVLDSRYGRRLAEVEAAIADLPAPALETPGPAAPERARNPCGTDLLANRLDGAARASAAGRMRRCLAGRRTRLLVGIGAAVCFAVAAILLAASLAGVRLPGESATGSVSVSSAQLEQETLDRAAILGSEGRVAEAVQLYNQVLQKDPNQPDALVYGGWLVRLAGLASKNQLVVARGDASVARAVKIAPAYPDGHALFGVILYEDFGRPGAASVQFRDALDTRASKNLLMSVAAIAAKAFAASREPLPSRYGAAARSAAMQAPPG